MSGLSSLMKVVLFCFSVIWKGAESGSGECLASPDSLSWTKNSAGYSASIDYGVASFEWDIDGVATTFRSRVYEGQIPGPTIRMKRGERYFLTLNNNLGPESPTNPETNNLFKDSNTTNIHTHGLHISGSSMADNVFTKVAGGESWTYDYYIPCFHSAGTHWYHPHHHGSTTLQVGSGAVGLLFIEEDTEYNSEGLPDWLIDINDDEPLDLIIQTMYTEIISNIFFLVYQPDPTLDMVTEYSGAGEFVLLNGEYKPTICLEAGTWKRINMLNADWQKNTTLRIEPASNTSDSECVLMLLSRDGVLVHGEDNETPRDIDWIYFATGSRNDILISCDADTFAIINNKNYTIGYINATGDAMATDADDLEVFNPVRPSYLTSTLDVAQNKFNTWSQHWNFEGLNDVLFPGTHDPFHNFSADSYQEWTVTGTVAHPYHQHVYHFQLTEDGQGNDLRGDWLDVLQTDNVIRFKTTLWGGDMIVHCHKLLHEDAGVMALFHIHGGCQYNFTDFPTEQPKCDYECDTTDAANILYSLPIWAIVLLSLLIV